MPTRYFIENNQKTSYLAFDAPELHMQVIKKSSMTLMPCSRMQKSDAQSALRAMASIIRTI